MSEQLELRGLGRPPVVESEALMSGAQVSADLYRAMDELPPDVQDRFACAGGAVGSPGYLRQLERDARWEMFYYVRRDSATIIAAIPIILPRWRSWTDPYYDPMLWFPGKELDPHRTIIAGGMSGFSSTAWIGAEDKEAVGRVLSDLAAIGATFDRDVVLPYTHGLVARLATSPPFIVAQQSAVVHFDRVLLSGERFLSSKQRAVYRRDGRLAAELDIRANVVSWSEVADDAAPLISAHNVDRGTPDAPQLVDLRLRRWESVSDVKLVVFRVSSGTERGYVTAIEHKSDLTVQELAITAGRGTLRTQLYVHAVIHQPLEFARARKLRTMRVGLEGSVAKTSRGGVPESRDAILLCRGPLSRRIRFWR